MNFFAKYLIVLGVVFLCATSQAADKLSADGNYRIGLILPLSGPSAYWGTYLKNGALLGHSKLAETSRSKIELIFEDDHLDAAAAVSAYRKLRDTNKINAVILFGAQSGRSVIPLAEKEGIVSFVITSDPGAVLNT